MNWIRRPGVWLLAALSCGLVVALATQGSAEGAFTSVALAAGGLAYALMAINLLLALRLPVLERLFGPLDRLYRAHRAIGTAIVAVIGLHLVCIPIASAADRQEGLLENPGPAIPLGIVGTLIIFGSVALALNPKIPYHRWQRFHIAIAGGFVVLTAHFIVGGSKWISLASPSGALLGAFMALGFTSIVLRLIGRRQHGSAYEVVSVTARERGVEVHMKPLDDGVKSHRPGQFVFLTANPGNQRETHPFSVTSCAGSDQVSVLIRPSGDWTERVQDGLTIGDKVALNGPFGGFTPQLGEHAPPSQAWVAAGAGITPFLSVLRTAKENSTHVSVNTRVELVCIARSPGDLPCWQEIVEFEQQFPWLTVRPWFTHDIGRPSPQEIRRLVREDPAKSAWYLCGPQQVSVMFEREIRALTQAVIHHEIYHWRGAPAKGRTSPLPVAEPELP